MNLSKLIKGAAVLAIAGLVTVSTQSQARVGRQITEVVTNPTQLKVLTQAISSHGSSTAVLKVLRDARVGFTSVQLTQIKYATFGNVAGLAAAIKSFHANKTNAGAGDIEALTRAAQGTNTELDALVAVVNGKALKDFTASHSESAASSVPRQRERAVQATSTITPEEALALARKAPLGDNYEAAVEAPVAAAQEEAEAMGMPVEDVASAKVLKLIELEIKVGGIVHNAMTGKERCSLVKPSEVCKNIFYATGEFIAHRPEQTPNQEINMLGGIAKHQLTLDENGQVVPQVSGRDVTRGAKALSIKNRDKERNPLDPRTQDTVDTCFGQAA